MPQSKQDRRDFLKTTTAVGAAASVPYFFSTPKTLADETKGKNDRITIGVIGAGGMANGNMRSARDWLDVVAIADVDAGRRESSNKNMSGGKADVYEDYREVLARDDVDVIHIATPDHWHTKPLIEAMLAGKDVYCEKPLTLTIDEGKLIRKVQKETGAIVQVGTQQRSTFPLFVKAMAIVAEGRLGRIEQVQAAIGGAPTSPAIPVADVPQELNWDRWLGPAPKVDYRYLASQKRQGSRQHQLPLRVPLVVRVLRRQVDRLGRPSRRHLQLGAQAERPNRWAGLDRRQRSSIRSSSRTDIRCKTIATIRRPSFSSTVKYPGGTEMIIRNDTDNGVLITGDRGRIFVSRGKLAGKPVEDLANNPLPEDAISKVYKNMPMERNERERPLGEFLALRAGTQRTDFRRALAHGNVERLSLGGDFRAIRSRPEMGQRQRRNRRRQRSERLPLAALPRRLRNRTRLSCQFVLFRKLRIQNAI